MSTDTLASYGLTEAQVATMRGKWERADQGKSWQEFLDSAITLPCEKAVAVPWENMWLCIETDGYSHT